VLGGGFFADPIFAEWRKAGKAAQGRRKFTVSDNVTHKTLKLDKTHKRLKKRVFTPIILMPAQSNPRTFLMVAVIRLKQLPAHPTSSCSILLQGVLQPQFMVTV